MRLPTRLRVRTMMAIIALIALGFAVAFEYKNHAERDRLLRLQADIYRDAAIHHKRALECNIAEERQDPYRPAERAKLLASDRAPGSFTPPGGFPSWEAERLHHQFWGNRIYDQADSLDPRLQAVEARLLLPFPTGR
jgi:hypothetical protein